MARNIDRRIGRRVKELRQAKQLTQEQLAEQIDRTVDTISNLERGASLTRLEVILRIADALSVQPSEIFSFEPKPAEYPLDPDRAALLQLLADAPADVVQAVRDQAEILLRVYRSSQISTRRPA